MRKNTTYFLIALCTCVPLITFAQGGDKDTVQGYLILITKFIGDTLLPLLFAIALLFFLVNVARYFIVGGNQAESQEKAKTLAIYGIAAFVFLISIWGIVNMFVEGFEIDDTAARCPDYLGRWCTTKDAYSGQYQNSFESYDSPYREQEIEVFDAQGNRVKSGSMRVYEENTTSETFTVYDRNGNVVNEKPIDVTTYGEDKGNVYRVADDADPTVDEHEEEFQNEEAPVNIGQTNSKQERGTCTTSASGIETCDLLQKR